MISLVDTYMAERTIRECGAGLYVKQFLMSWKSYPLTVMWDVLANRLMDDHYIEDNEVVVVENIIRKHLTNR